MILILLPTIATGYFARQFGLMCKLPDAYGTLESTATRYELESLNELLDKKVLDNSHSQFVDSFRRLVSECQEQFSSKPEQIKSLVAAVNDAQIEQAKKIVIEEMQASVLMPNQMSDALLRLGLIAKAMMEFEEAIRYLNQADSLVPKSSEVLFHIAGSYFALKSYQDAIVFYEKALNAISNNGDDNRSREICSHYDIGRCYKTIGLQYEAIKHLELVLVILLEYESANITHTLKTRYRLGLAYSSLANNQKVIEHLSIALAPFPSAYSEAHLALGLAYQAAGNYEKALTHLELSHKLELEGTTSNSEELKSSEKNICKVSDLLRLSHLKQKLQENINIHDEKHYQSIIISNQIGLLLTKLEEYKESLSFYRLKWACIPVSSENEYPVLVPLSEAKPEEGLNLSQQAYDLEIYSKTYGNAKNDAAYSKKVNDLSAVYCSLNRLNEAGQKVHLALKEAMARTSPNKAHIAIYHTNIRTIRIRVECSINRPGEDIKAGYSKNALESYTALWTELSNRELLYQEMLLKHPLVLMNICIELSNAFYSVKSFTEASLCAATAHEALSQIEDTSYRE